jgi:hypothetical protein
MTTQITARLSQAGALVCTLCLALLAGCADLNWNRSIYQGMKFSAEHCTIKQRTDTAPCADLRSRDQYERERATLKPAIEKAADN